MDYHLKVSHSNPIQKNEPHTLTWGGMRVITPSTAALPRAFVIYDGTQKPKQP